MKKSLIFLFLIMFFGVAPIAYGCQPCPKDLSFEESAKKADLIIVGQKTKDGPSTKGSGQLPGGPDWIEVKITEILKGDLSKNKIRVNSWNGMCAYGINVDNEQYIMFLEKGGEVKSDEYDAVNGGCAEKTFKVSGDTVLLDKQNISIDDFVTKLGAGASRKKVEDKNENSTNTWSNNIYCYLVISAVVIFIVLIIFFVLKKRKKA